MKEKFEEEQKLAEMKAEEERNKVDDEILRLNTGFEDLDEEEKRVREEEIKMIETEQAKKED